MISATIRQLPFIEERFSRLELFISRLEPFISILVLSISRLEPFISILVLSVSKTRRKF